MQNDADSNLIALYRHTARDIPNDNLDRAILGKARAVAWRRRHRAHLLAAASCGIVTLFVGLWSADTTTKTPAIIDTAQYGMTDGRAQLYATNVKFFNTQDGFKPGLNVHPAIATNDHLLGVK